MNSKGQVWVALIILVCGIIGFTILVGQVIDFKDLNNNYSYINENQFLKAGDHYIMGSMYKDYILDGKPLSGCYKFDDKTDTVKMIWFYCEKDR